MDHRIRHRTPALPTLLALGAVLGVALVSTVAYTNRPDDRTAASVSRIERHAEFNDDLRMVRHYDAGLDRTIGWAEANRQILPAPDGPSATTTDQRRALRQVHAQVIDRVRALDQIKAFWRGAHRISPLTDRQAHARTYLVGWAAWLVQYRHGQRWIGMTVPNPAVERILDEPAPDYDLPARSFARLKANVIHVANVSRLAAGHRYYRTLRDDLSASGCHHEAECRWAMATVEAHYAQARRDLAQRGAAEFGYNAFDIVRDLGFRAWFPVQKRVAAWMGDTTYRPHHDHLIGADELAYMRQRLEPGDIVVARHNWYLSNAGLPGFWPHAELYVGAPGELGDYFDTPEVRAHFRREHGAEGLADYLEREHPRAWQAYTRRADHGREHRVLEAVSDGVVFSSLTRAAGADYAAAMRPERSRLDKALAIAAAFGHWGKPYDFNFDFMTDRTLVCTELVTKAWEPGRDRQGLRFEPVEVMGRTTLPANALVRQFGAQADAGELSFVFFVDGREATGDAIIADEAAFRRSWQRPKWDFAQR